MVGFVSLLRVPALSQSFWYSAAIPASVLSLLFYLRLGMKPFLQMLVMLATCVVLCLVAEVVLVPVWPCYAVVFVLAWIGQAVGHSFEGKKPSFFKDVQFLLIGPLWILKRHG